MDTQEKIKDLEEAGYKIAYVPMVVHPRTNELIDIDEAYKKAFHKSDFFETMDKIRNVKQPN